jgi:zinc transport system substrate-binding protein
VRAPARYRLLLAILALLAAAGCQQGSPPDGKPLVVASFYPMYEFARQVAGDRAQVVSLVPTGVEPHDWEPSPQDMAQVRRARLFVYNGAGLEPWAEKVKSEVDGKTTAVVSASAGIPLVGGDPHVWLDPTLARAEVEAIRAALTRVDPGGAELYAAQAKAFAAKLDALDERFAAGLRDCARREVVVSHAAFGYLTRRYRLEQVPVMGLAPESEPSPAALAAIVRLARQRKVEAVFFETLVNRRLADTLAREVGARTLVLNPIEGLTREEAAAGKGYLDLMTVNLADLREGLGCR